MEKTFLTIAFYNADTGEQLYCEEVNQTETMDTIKRKISKVVDELLSLYLPKNQTIELKLLLVIEMNQFSNGEVVILNRKIRGILIEQFESTEEEPMKIGVHYE